MGLIKSLKPLDDIDTRREVVLLLQKLSPVERVAWLYYCCDQIGILGIDPSTNKPIQVTITNESGDIMECYLDFFGLVGQYGLDGKSALAELERRVVKLTSSASKRIYIPE